MLIFSLSVFIALVVSMGVCFAAWGLSKRSLNDREKNSPFECGFDPKLSARLPFSIRFFLLAVIFLIFDVEIALLLPFPLLSVSFYSIPGLFCALMFLVILVLGLFHEWREGSLDWVEQK